MYNTTSAITALASFSQQSQSGASKCNEYYLNHSQCLWGECNCNEYYPHHIQCLWGQCKYNEYYMNCSQCLWGQGEMNLRQDVT
uniref:Uncharacterized protein n=1 Tax=Anguilla anguilla TaxID=7936 RepID=A0A0E9RVP9_ANGAN